MSLAGILGFWQDAIEVLKYSIPDNSLDKVQIFFPDPWHKKRHHKRRLIQEAFAALLAKKLNVGGKVHLATDWQHYAEQMMQVFSDSPQFSNIVGAQNYLSEKNRPDTKFEQRGLKLGHQIWDMIFIKEFSGNALGNVH